MVLSRLYSNDKNKLENNITSQNKCHCGSHLSFEDCCEKYLSQSVFPKTAEQLMRSRFTAFKLRCHDYLINTVQASINKTSLTELSFDTRINWLGLKVISCKKGQQNDEQGTVEFVAFFQEAKEENSTRFHQLHEESNFNKMDGYWIYIDGKPLKDIKLERNDKCFCNSDKKFKKCHDG